jgi:hypothetical protein
MAARKLVVYKEIMAELVKFEADYSSIVVDCSDAKGMKSAKDCRKEIRDARSNLEDLRKETKAPVLDKGKQIDAEAKAITVRLDVLFTKFDTAIKAIENKAAIAKQTALDEALAKVKELETREQAIIAKEIELGLREAPEDSSKDIPSSNTTTSAVTSTNSSMEVSSSSANVDVPTICEPHIKAAAERLAVIKKVRGLVEPTDAQPTGDIDAEIARKHDEVLGEIWDLVDRYK